MDAYAVLIKHVYTSRNGVTWITPFLLCICRVLAIDDFHPMVLGRAVSSGLGRKLSSNIMIYAIED